MHRNALKWMLLTALAFGSLALYAQDQEPSKVDFFTGYSYFNPRTRAMGVDLGDAPKGFNLNSTYFVNKWVGFTLDGGGHFGDRVDVGSLSVGPTFRFPTSSGVTPFIHALVGWQELSAAGLSSDSGVALTGGGGLDFHTKWPRVNIRLIQADIQYSPHNPNFTHFESVGARLSTGLVWRFGTFGPPAAPPSAACKAEPAEVFEGEPVTVSATTQGFNPKHTLTYNWSGAPGVNVKGTNETAQVDTKGMQPGSYPVKVTVADKKLTAECTANVVIKQPRPPQISCSANPATVKPGETSTISSQGSSPDNRPLKYSYTASSGQISGNEATATLNTQGAEAGSSVNVTCTVTDDRNLSANSSTSVSVEAPPAPAPAAAPEPQKVNTLNFKKNSARVDNAAKAILDDVALRLQRDADAKAVIVGNVDKGENKRLAGQRASNAKAYLVKEKGIDPSRVEVRTGSTPGTTADIWIVPAGATFNAEGTQTVTETAPAARKKAAAAKKKQ
jgi:outer membrane protein OmpA-like peptidoglycan-associated protein